MGKVQSVSTVVFSVVAMASAGYGIFAASRSSLFSVRIVEIDQSSEKESFPQPLDSETIHQLAGVKVGQENLFSLKLSQIESRILQAPWVRTVSLEKKLPQKLAIHVQFREPLARFAHANGDLGFVDADVKVFNVSEANHATTVSYDLPVVTGIAENSEELRQAIKWIQAWNQSDLARTAVLSSIGFDPKWGYQAQIAYQLPEKKSWSRPVLRLGQKFDDSSFASGRLSRVVRYLSSQSTPAQRISLIDEKKIVVKTARGS